MGSLGGEDQTCNRKYSCSWKEGTSTTVAYILCEPPRSPRFLFLPLYSTVFVFVARGASEIWQHHRWWATRTEDSAHRLARSLFFFAFATHSIAREHEHTPTRSRDEVHDEVSRCASRGSGGVAELVGERFAQHGEAPASVHLPGRDQRGWRRRYEGFRGFVEVRHDARNP